MKTYSKRTVINHDDERATIQQDRLNHYNDWLRQAPCNLDDRYPGYPGDRPVKRRRKSEPTTAMPIEQAVVSDISKPSKSSKALKGNVIMSTEMKSTMTIQPTKLVRETKQMIVNRLCENIALDTKDGRRDAIDLIIKETAMTKSGATTYMYNARRFWESNRATA